MPIRINLLAELQAAEEERRTDPVKRGVWCAGVLVAVVVLWAAWLQIKVIAAKSQLGTLQTKWKSIEKGYDAAVAVQRRHGDTEDKLAALRNLSTNRFLWGNVLNAFQQTLNNIEDVQVVRLKSDQTYTVSEAVPNRTNGTSVVRGKPATATQRVIVSIEAMDSSSQAGSRISTYRDAIAQQQYFQQNLATTNGLRLTSRSAPQAIQGSAGQFVLFSLECAFPEKVR